MNAANFQTNKGRKLGKYLLVAVIIGAIAVILISTGSLTWRDLVGIHFKLIKICPFCM